MKLMEIRGLIRKTTGNPKLTVPLGNATAVEIIVQKVPFLAALGEAFDGDKNAETGLTFDPVTSVVSEIENSRAAPALNGDWEDDGRGIPPRPRRNENDDLDGPLDDEDEDDDLL